MRELSSRQGCFSDIHLRKSCGHTCRTRFFSSSFRTRDRPVRCTAYRADSEDETATQRQGPARTALSQQLLSLQLQKSRSSNRLIRRREVPAQPAVDGEDPSSQLPQRSQPETQDRLPVRPRAQGLLRARDSSSRLTLPPRLQQAAEKPQEPAQKDGKPSKPFNAKKDKMSPKDWKVATDHIVTDMHEGLLDARTWRELVRECGLDPARRPQATLYHQLGMSKSDFSKLNESRRYDGLLELRVPTIKTKLNFFRDELGLSDSELCRLLVKCPRVMEHRLESTVRPHLEFLQLHGVPQHDLGKVIQSAPQCFQLSIPKTLQPRVDFLKDLGVPAEGITKIIIRQPSVLTYTTQFMQVRLNFLRATGMTEEQVAKVIVSHPQVLHYDPDSMQQKLQYLKEIGMDQQQRSYSILRLPQLLSLDVKHNMRPKYNYLQSQLGGSIQTLSEYPGYFSLSLFDRIIPRHRYLQVVRAEPINPFPMNYLKVTDQRFADRIAHTPLLDFESFRADLRDRLTPRP